MLYRNCLGSGKRTRPQGCPLADSSHPAGLADGEALHAHGRPCLWVNSLGLQRRLHPEAVPEGDGTRPKSGYRRSRYRVRSRPPSVSPERNGLAGSTSRQPGIGRAAPGEGWRSAAQRSIVQPSPRRHWRYGGFSFLLVLARRLGELGSFWFAGVPAAAALARLPSAVPDFWGPARHPCLIRQAWDTTRGPRERWSHATPQGSRPKGRAPSSRDKHPGLSTDDRRRRAVAHLVRILCMPDLDHESLCFSGCFPKGVDLIPRRAVLALG